MSKLGHELSHLRMLRCDQVILYFFILLVFGAMIVRYAASRPRAPLHTQVLEAGDQVAYRVDLNSAGTAELELLPGIGPAKAKAIIRYRERHGPFRALSDLTEVSGVSDHIVGALKGLVTPDAVAQGEPAR